MKTVLLPTDFSTNSFNAAAYALDMYRDEKVLFILMHAYKVFDYHEKSLLTATPGITTMEKTLEEIEEQLKTGAEDLKQKAGKNHLFKISAYNLLLVDAIKKELRNRKVELIIIGNQGSTGNTEVIYGSNTLNVMEEIENCPVLSIPSDVVFTPPGEIVLANSFKAELVPGDLDFLISLARKYESAIRILHIAETGGLNKSQHHNRKRLEEKLTTVKHSFHSLEYLSVSMGIYSFTESRGSGMVAFINKKHSVLQNLLMNPVYRDLAHYSKVPVLVLHQLHETD